MNKWKKTIEGILSMCPAAWNVFLACVQGSVCLLFGAWVFLLRWSEDVMNGHEYYIQAFSLNETAQILLLVAAILPVCLEDLHRKG